LGNYQTDPAELETMDMLYQNAPQNVYVTPDKKCYYLPTILTRWESSFSLYDSQSVRVVPQYPSDYDQAPMPPDLIRDIWYQALHNNPETKQQYPLLDVLIDHGSNLLDDLYSFILGYDRLTRAYEVAPLAIQNDPAAPNRRDLQAIHQLEGIYGRNHLPNYGWRKYSFIKSERGLEGTQVFYQCVLVSFFRFHRWKTVHGGLDDRGKPIDLRWVREPGPCMMIGDRDPCRPCLQDYLVEQP